MTNGSRRRLGSIRQEPNGRWWARITVGCNVDGRPRTVTKTHDTKAEAEAWLMAKSVELMGHPDISAGITMAALWAAYEHDREGKLANKTLAQYRWYVKGAKKGNAFNWSSALGDMDVSEITPQVVQRHLSTLSSAKAHKAKASISAVLSWATTRGIIGSNPLMGHKFEYASAKRSIDFDTDPFAAIEQPRNVWGINDVLKCLEKIRGLPLEPAWLACVGAGLRVEEALALRRMDVRRVKVGGRKVTQLAVHAARTDMDERKATKTAQSVRIVGMLEPMGKRYWQIAKSKQRDELVCPMSASNQNKRWRGYFAKPSTSVNAPKKEGCNNLGRLHELPYLPLSKMRNTHVTIMAESGVSDSINALMHGHTQMVERRHYLSPDMTDATVTASERFKLVV